jgi:hypothetical protein
VLLVFGTYLVLEMLLYKSNDQYIQTTLNLTEMRKCTICQAKYPIVILVGHFKSEILCQSSTCLIDIQQSDMT